MKIKVLDGLRGYAALLIILAHIPHISDTIIAKYLRIIIDISKIGYLGVDIFFVLSGFLITRILIKEKIEQRFSFVRFYLKRSLRIFPIYYLVVFFSGILFTWKGVEYIVPYLSNYYFSFYLEPHPLRHVWSLAVEEHFYIFWPVLLYIFKLKTSKKLILYTTPILIVLGFIFTYSYYDIVTANNLVYRASHFRILSLAIGSFFAFIESKIMNLGKNGVISTILVFISSYVLAVFVYKIEVLNFMPLSILLFLLLSITSSSFLLFILQFENKPGIINFIFTNKAINYVGLISYGIYLYHFPIFYYFNITHNQLGGDLVSFKKVLMPIFLTFLIPTISYYGIEKPLLKVKNKI